MNTSISTVNLKYLGTLVNVIPNKFIEIKDSVLLQWGPTTIHIIHPSLLLIRFTIFLNK
jgi:hypothetical protein